MPNPIVCDTHALVYWAAEPKRLSPKARRVMESGLAQGRLACADISLWEIAMLADRGRLRLPIEPCTFIDDLLTALGLAIVPINAAIACLAQESFAAHADPADRLIAATAMHLDAALVTRDTRLGEHPRLKTVW